MNEKANQTGTSVDVDVLMSELRAQVAKKKAAGLYAVDALAEEPTSCNVPFRSEDLAELAKLAEIYVDLEVTRSTKRYVAAPVGRVKSGLVRATSQPLQDVADRATSFHLALLSYVSMLAQELESLRAELNALRGSDEQTTG